MASGGGLAIARMPHVGQRPQALRPDTPGIRESISILRTSKSTHLVLQDVLADSAMAFSESLGRRYELLNVQRAIWYSRTVHARLRNR